VAARRISLVNFKGGVGKTTLAVNLAACLAHDLNQRVLLVDCDAQANSSIWLLGLGRFTSGYDTENSVYGVLTGANPFLEKAIRKSVVQSRGSVGIQNLDLLPSVFELMDVEHEFHPKGGLEATYGKFYQTLSSVFSSYDYIIFDCPPNVYRASKAALFASQEIYIPCNPDALSNMGLALLRKKVSAFHQETATFRRDIRGHLFPRIRGVILNRVPPGRIDEEVQKISLKIRSFREYRNIAAEDCDILPTKIRQSIAAERIVDKEVPFILSKDNPDLKKDYVQLARFIHGSPLKD